MKLNRGVFLAQLFKEKIADINIAYLKYKQ